MECVYCAVRTEYLCVLYGSENKQRLFPYTALTGRFLGACAKIAESGCYLRHVRPPVFLSVCMEQLGSHWTDLHEN